MAEQSIITLMAGLLFLFPTNGYGQEIMSIEQEREIKELGNYYFGECMAIDEAEAEECALKELMQEVIVSVLKQTLIEKNGALLKNLEMNANTARLPMTGSFKILAYIAKDSIYIQSASVRENIIDKPEESVQKTEPQSGISKKDLQPESTDQNSSRPVVSNPIIQDLADVRNFDLLRRKAKSWRRQVKLVYGSRKTAFIFPKNCNTAVFSSYRTLIALLCEGNNSQVDFVCSKS